MSYQTLALTIALFVNLFVWLVGPAGVQAPMIGLIRGVMTGNFTGISLTTFLVAVATASGIALAVFAITALLSGPASLVTGATFGGMHAMTVISIAVFVAFFALPNIGFMGIPEPVATIVNVFFGFMVFMGIEGLITGR